MESTSSSDEDKATKKSSKSKFKLRMRVPTIKKGREGTRMYKCEKCDFKTPQRYWLRQHQMSRHPTDPKCNLCKFGSRSSVTMDELKKHVREEHSKGPEDLYHCEKCGHKWYSRVSKMSLLYLLIKLTMSFIISISWKTT